LHAAPGRVGEKEDLMSLGLGIVLFAIGAILTWALNVTVDWIDLQMVGIILMVAGAVVVVFGIILLARRRRTIATSHTSIDPATGERVTRDESSTPEV
jgi:membrane-bound ClpP family serine protease